MTAAAMPVTTVVPKVLMVDDRPENLLALEAVLASLPCDLVRAESGDEALRRLLHDEFAVILLDVQMPGLDGYETAAHIKARDRTRNIPIIFLTAIDRELHHQLRGYGAGAVDFIAKPFVPEVLVSKVSVFLDLYNQAKLIDLQRTQLAAQVEELSRAEQDIARQATELQRSNTELERFSVAVSGELREPISITSGFLEVLSERHAAGLDDEGRRILDRACAGVTDVGRRIDELLAYSQASTEELHLRPVDLGTVLDGAQRQVGPVLTAASGVVTHDPLPKVRGDAWQLQRVFAELLENAAAAARPDVDLEVHVGLSRRDGDWVLTVRDNGRGIPPDQLPDLFGLFARLPRGGHSHGVGLAVCRRSIERHGGTMWADSVVGQGTSVSFTLPVTGDDATPTAVG